MCSVLSINASVFSLIQGRPSMRSGVTAVLSAAGIAATGWIASSLVSVSQLTTSGWIGRLLLCSEKGASVLLGLLVAVASLVVLLSAFLPEPAAARVFFRCDGRACVRAMRLLIGAIALAATFEFFSVEPALEHVFLLLAFVFFPERRRKAIRFGQTALLLWLLHVGLTFFVSSASLGAVFFGAAEALFCGLFGIALVRAFGVRMPR